MKFRFSCHVEWDDGLALSSPSLEDAVRELFANCVNHGDGVVVIEVFGSHTGKQYEPVLEIEFGARAGELEIAQFGE